jgi:D-glycero-D-manno-heptose 1,7-bisphosphate phosphatase
MAGDDAEGNWLQLRAAARDGPARPALFLDRDGVLLEEVGFLHRPELVRPIAGAGAALAEMHRRGWWLVLVTNQSGIGRGLYGWEDFRAVQARLDAVLAEDGVALDAVLACPFHADGQGLYRRADHPWRKPAPGMIRAAADQLPIDLARSWIVGDRETDVAAGRAAALAGAVHVLTGYGREHRAAAERLAAANFAVRVIDSIAALPAALES